MMSAHLMIEAGPVLVLADFHYDAYQRRGLAPFEANGLQPLVGPHYAAIIVAGDLINDATKQLLHSMTTNPRHRNPPPRNPVKIFSSLLDMKENSMFFQRNSDTNPHLARSIISGDQP